MKIWIIAVLIVGMGLIGGIRTGIDWREDAREDARRIAYLERRLDLASGQLSERDRRLAALKAATAGTTERLAEVERQLADERIANDPLREEIKTQLAAQIVQQRKIDNHERRIRELQGNIGELETQLAAQIRAQSDLEAARKQIATLEGRIAERDKALAEAAQTQAAYNKLQTDHRALQKRIETLTAESKTLSETVARQKEQIQALGSRDN